MHGEPLPDCRAQRRPHDVRGRDAVTVQNSCCVSGHVGERVRVCCEIDGVGTAGVTMIEPDHLPTAVHESFDKLVGPADALRRSTHDQ